MDGSDFDTFDACRQGSGRVRYAKAIERNARRLKTALRKLDATQTEFWTQCRKAGATLLELKDRFPETRDFGEVLAELGITIDSRRRSALIWLARLERTDPAMLTFLLDRFPRSGSPESLQAAHTRLLKLSETSTPEVRDSPRRRPSKRPAPSTPAAAEDAAPSPATTAAGTLNQVGAILDAAIKDRDWEKVAVARASVDLVCRRFEADASRP